MVKIVEYSSDKESLVSLMEQLQDFLVEIDPLKRLKRPSTYGKVYVDDLLKKIQSREGMIYIAKIDEAAVGMVAGIIEKQTDVDKVDHIESKVGNIIELVVSSEHRGKKIGTALMNKIEEYFRLKRCDTAWVEVFVPNISAHNFYKKSDYQDRMIGMIKKL